MNHDSEEEIVRISISLPKDLYQRLDVLINKLNYPSRSKLIQDALESFIIEKQKRLDPNTQAAGAILILYEHEKSNIDERLVEIQHKYLNIIRSTTHLHLTHNLCFEVIVLEGVYQTMTELADELGVLKGVRTLKLVVSRVE